MAHVFYKKRGMIIVLAKLHLVCFFVSFRQAVYYCIYELCWNPGESCELKKETIHYLCIYRKDQFLEKRHVDYDLLGVNHSIELTK